MKRFVVAFALVVPLLAACQSTKPATSSTGAAKATSASNSAPAGAGDSAEGPFETKYGWTVPSNTQPTGVEHYPAGFPNDVTAPPAYLVEIRSSDHTIETPGYGRLSFYFQGAFPSYQVMYTLGVGSNSGGHLALEGDRSISLVFTFAQSKDKSGNNTIVAAPKEHLGYGSLRNYLDAGGNTDVAHIGAMTLRYGIGIQSLAGTGQPPEIRMGEWTKPDGKGGSLYVISFDAKAG